MPQDRLSWGTFLPIHPAKHEKNKPYFGTATYRHRRMVWLRQGARWVASPAWRASFESKNDDTATITTQLLLLFCL
jgi:hypothetical protein